MDTAFSRLSLSGAPNTYHTINISGNAQAVLGNVAPDNLPFHLGSGVDWKNTLKALYFEGMGVRKAQIAARASSPEYVEWVWRTKFVDWLSNDESFFWITGRAGSGKSTLMKHIADSRKTKQRLGQNGESWAVVHFFFDFRAGYTTANSLEGMLRSVLYQLVQRCPELVRNIDFMSHDDFLSLDLVSCLDYVCQVADTASFRVCAFIDGLDEFEGSGAELVETLYSLEDRAGFKLCLASRPYQIFESSFSRHASLTVQEFNDESIQMYVQAQWKNNRLGLQAGLPEAFGKKIRDKAGGVFLWARLAIDELLQDLIRGNSIAALEAQLDEMPKEVLDMYQRILDRVQPIMRLETATLLHMIMCSNFRDVQIRKLYIALDSHVRRQSMEYAANILPIDLDDEEGLNSRIINVLGDFIDVNPSYEEYAFCIFGGTENGDLIPTVVMHKNKLMIRKGPAPGASLTHETLRTFLDRNAWLRSHVAADIGKIAPQHLWINIYLNEMEIAASITPSDMDGVCSVVRNFAQRIYTLLWDKEWDEIDLMSESLLTILRGWRVWTPLLLLGIQDLLREVARCKSLDAAEAQKLVLVLQTQLMQYHLAICHFQSCSPAAVNEYYRHREGLPVGSISTDHCAYSLPNKLYGHADYIGWDNFFSICHGLPEIILHSPILDEEQAEINKIQELFNQVWTKYLDEKSGAKCYFALIDRLFSAGARLGGSHICLFLRHWYRYEDYEDRLPDLIRSLPGIELAHADDCDLKGHGDSGSTFLQHWVDFVDYSKDASKMPELISEFLLRCGVQINAISEGEPLINTLLTIDEDRFVFMMDRMKKVIIALRAGADPKLIGKDGNALQAARALSSILKDPPGKYWVKNLDIDIDNRRNRLEAQKREIVKIEEMLEEYLEKGSLTETQLEAYARFNCRSTLYHASDPWPELNPYRLFELDKD